MTTDNSVLPAVIEVPQVILPVDIDSAKRAMQSYQEVTSAILEASDWQGIPNREGAFVKKSGFRKIAKAYRLSVELLDETAEHDDDGRPLRARAVYRAIAPNGQYMDGVGFCSPAEPRFASARGRHKLENDLRATAATRAINRAISDLVAFGQVSAEEMEPGPQSPEPTVAPASPYGDDTTGDHEGEAGRIIQTLHPGVDGLALIDIFKRSLGVAALPEASYRAFKALEWALGEGARTVNVGVDGSVSGSERDESTQADVQE